MAVLIGRGLDHISLVFMFCFSLFLLYSVFRAFPEWSLCFVSLYFFFIQFSGRFLSTKVQYAPLAQLVEHLTLNQGVPGSSP